MGMQRVTKITSEMTPLKRLASLKLPPPLWRGQVVRALDLKSGVLDSTPLPCYTLDLLSATNWSASYQLGL